jgi:hypothetical protein
MRADPGTRQRRLVVPVRELPGHPNVRQLKHQAKDLLRAARAGEPAALAVFAEFHSEPINPSSAKLADAHLVLARSYTESSGRGAGECLEPSDGEPSECASVKVASSAHRAQGDGATMPVAVESVDAPYENG